MFIFENAIQFNTQQLTLAAEPNPCSRFSSCSTFNMSDNKDDSYKNFLESLEAKNNDKWTIQLEKFLKSGGKVKNLQHL